MPVGSRLSGTVRITSATPRRCAKVVVEVWYCAFMPDRNGDLFETVDRVEMLHHGELHGDDSTLLCLNARDEREIEGEAGR